MRLLEQHRAEYEVFEFDSDIHSAVGVAEAVGVPGPQFDIGLLDGPFARRIPN